MFCNCCAHPKDPSLESNALNIIKMILMMDLLGVCQRYFFSCLLSIVGLSATGHGGSPVLLDSTAPVAGDIMDGEKLGQDACCHDDNTSICVQWQHFEDPESHIERWVVVVVIVRVVVYHATL